MANELGALGLCVATVVGPLAWCRWRDHQTAKALLRRLEGESLVFVQVTPAAPW